MENSHSVGILYPNPASWYPEGSVLRDHAHGGEADYPQLAASLVPPATIHLVHTKTGGSGHSIEATHSAGRNEYLLAGVEELRAKNVASCMWACTSGSFTYGLEGAKQQALEISDALGVPASSSSLAFLSALSALSITRIAIAATYPKDLAHAFQVFLTDGGIEVVHVGSMGIWFGAEATLMEREKVLNFARESDHPDAEAVLIPDTALRTVGFLAELDAFVGKPVLTSNQVTMWEGLRLANSLTPQSHLGRLMALST